MADYSCFNGKLVVIIGGAMGIGESCALMFAKQGAKVVVADINREKGRQLSEQVTAEGGWLNFIESDATDPEAVTRLASQIKELGQVYVLVNATGGFTKYIPTTEMPIDHWEKVIRLNLYSTFYSCREIGRLMQAGGQGAIINLSSLAARTSYENTAVHYSAAKAGVEALTRVLASELGPSGIRVNAVAPGTTITERILKLRSQEEIDNWGQQTARKKLATPEEIASVVLFLASDGAVHITGVSLDVNGGQIIV